MINLQTTLGGLSCRVLQQASPGASLELAVVLCHGFGAPGDDLVSLAPEILRARPELAQKVRFVFPEAPLSLAGQGYGGGRAWWPLDVQRLAVRWTMLGIETPTPLFIDPRIDEAEPLLRPPTEGQAIVADYGSLGLTLRRHPLALLRARFDRLGFETAAGVQRLAHGDSVRTAGLVIMRQRPGTATGVVFVTLEDETGYVNLIVWSSLVEQQRKALLGSRLLGVVGEVQREGRVVHVLARTLEDHTRLLGRLATQSRDFH